jgi:hypothetical protein
VDERFNMGLTNIERSSFINFLMQKDWAYEEDIIWSPSRGLYFSDSHFNSWTLNDFHIIFLRRSKRIHDIAFEGWEVAYRENQDVSDIAKELI